MPICRPYGFLEVYVLFTDSTVSYDFCTLYTNLPHTKIKEAFRILFKTVFHRESKAFINVNLKKAFFSDNSTRGYTSLKESDFNKILFFILDNIYVKFGSKIFKQKKGIPIGLDSGQDIANLLLYYYESDYVKELSRDDIVTARKFCNSSRYIDDLFSADFSDFGDHLPHIYPPELELTKSNNDDLRVDYLDLRIVSDNNSLNFSLYDKRDAFNFEVVNFPFLDSCIPRNPALGVYYGQLIRIARICTKFEDFYERTRALSGKLLRQGYKHRELLKLTVKFFRVRSNLIDKYHVSDINTFLNRVIFGN